MASGKIEKLPDKLSTLEDIHKLEAEGMECEQAMNRSMGQKTLRRKLDPAQRYKYYYFENENGNGGWSCAQRLKALGNNDKPVNKTENTSKTENTPPKKPVTAGEKIAKLVRQFPDEYQTAIREEVRGMISSGKTPSNTWKSLVRRLHSRAMETYITVAANNKLDVGDAEREKASSDIFGWIITGEDISSITFKISQLVQVQKGDIDLDVNDLKKSHFNDSAEDKLNRANDIDN